MANLYGAVSGTYGPSASSAAVAEIAATTYLLGRWSGSLNPHGNPNTNYDDDRGGAHHLRALGLRSRRLHVFLQEQLRAAPHGFDRNQTCRGCED